MTDQFAEDVLAGLSACPKTLSSKYFYDDRGNDLFVEIMDMPEYYLTRAEMEIFTEKTDVLIDAMGQSLAAPFSLLELGAGDGQKTVHLLRRLLERGYDFTYHPVDISGQALSLLQKRLRTQLPNLKIEPHKGDYFNQLNALCKTPSQLILLFLGSNLGNFSDKQSTQFLAQIAQTLKSEDKILLGVDKIKSVDIVLPAYNDAAGITARFNLNLLERMNRELGANFDLSCFRHAPEYREEEGLAISHIESLCDQTVFIKTLNQDFSFKTGEKIHTEVSRKYTLEIMADIIAGTDLKITDVIMDNKDLFYNIMLSRK